MKYPNSRFSLLVRSFCIPVAALVVLVQAKAADNLSLKLEIGRALDKGVTWLNGEQNASSGNWGEPEYPNFAEAYNRHVTGDVRSHKRSLDGFSDYAEIVYMVDRMQGRGYTEKDVANILGGNFLRVYEQVWT